MSATLRGRAAANPDSSVVVFLSVVVLAAAMVTPACFSGYSCDRSQTELTIPVSALWDPADGGAADGGVQDLVSRCQASATDCLPLCQRATNSGYLYFNTCELVSTDAGLAVHVVYPTPCGL